MTLWYERGIPQIEKVEYVRGVPIVTPMERQSTRFQKGELKMNLMIDEEVTVWFGDTAAKLAGKIVAVITPGESFRVKITSRGTDLSEAYDWIVGEEFDMGRLKNLNDATYDEYFWSPKGEVLPGDDRVERTE